MFDEAIPNSLALGLYERKFTAWAIYDKDDKKDLVKPLEWDIVSTGHCRGRLQSYICTFSENFFLRRLEITEKTGDSIWWTNISSKCGMGSNPRGVYEREVCVHIASIEW